MLTPATLKGYSVGDRVAYSDDEYIVRELIPHGTYSKGGVILDPQPTEFDPNLGRYIGDWLGLENAECDGEYCALPCSWVRQVRRDSRTAAMLRVIRGE